MSNIVYEQNGDEKTQLETHLEPILNFLHHRFYLFYSQLQQYNFCFAADGFQVPEQVRGFHEDGFFIGVGMEAHPLFPHDFLVDVDFGVLIFVVQQAER